MKEHGELLASQGPWQMNEGEEALAQHDPHLRSVGVSYEDESGGSVNQRSRGAEERVAEPPELF